MRLVMVLLIFLPLYACESAKPTLDSAKIEERERLLQEVPTYPGMVEVGRAPSSPDAVEEGRRYKSEASFANVKRFYIERLTAVFIRVKRGRDISPRTLS